MILFYVLGVVLFILAVWQTILRSSHYKIIGASALLFAIGIALVLLGIEDIGKFLIYIFESWYVMLILLVLSGKIKDHLRYLKPLIFLYAVSVALLYWFFDIRYFWVYLPVTAVFLFFNLKIQLDKKDEDKMFSHIQFETLHGGLDKKLSNNKAAETSLFKRFTSNHLYMGTAVYVLSLTIAYFIFNGGL